MKTRVDDALREEAAQFRLRFRCEACAHFTPESGACANEYPNRVHREVRLESVQELEFCKEFELS